MGGKARFDRWGKHYIRALMRSHQLQQCTNFLDPGVQVYGGRQFKILREKGDHIFTSLPPPTPSGNSAAVVRTSTYTPPVAAASPQVAPQSTTRPEPEPTWTPAPSAPAPTMQRYYNGAGGG